MYTLEQIYEALGKIENGGTDGALKNLIATLTALQNAGGALSTLDTQMNGLKFQSTLLMRGATAVMLCASTAKCHFNPRSSCEERRVACAASCASPHFNPRSSCEERLRDSAVERVNHYFNPRSSCEERRSRCTGTASRAPYFNPRSSCEERLFRLCASLLCCDFNPRSSCEERRASTTQSRCSSRFQSTLLMRGATVADIAAVAIIEFQSTLLMRGATSSKWYRRD